MLSLLGSLIGGLGKARQYSAQASAAEQQAALTRLRGESAKNEAYATAAGIEDTDRANKYLRGMQQRQARGQETREVSAARNAHSGTNTTVEAGAQMEDRVREAWDAQIENMATSSSVSTANAMQRALDTRRRGESAARWAEVEAMGYDAQAEQYRSLAKATRKSAQRGFIGGLLGSVAGGISGYMTGRDNLALLQEGIANGEYSMLTADEQDALLSRAEDNVVLSTLSGAGDYGSMMWDLHAAMNPYLAGMQIDTKGSGQTFYGLLSRGLSGLGGSRRRTNNAAWSNYNVMSDDYGLGARAGGEEGVSTSFDDGYLSPNFYNEYQRGLR